MILMGALLCPVFASAQTPAAAASTSATLFRGTVKSVNGSTLTLTTDAGQTVSLSLSPAVRVQQLAAGSTDLKTAQPSTVSEIAVGDRVLVSARGGEGASPAAARVILMKGADIAKRNAASQADWRKRGTGGIVRAVDTAAGTVSIAAGSRTEVVNTSKATVVRRYAAGSVKFEDAKPSALAEIHAGDQLRVRGERPADGQTMQAEEIVFGSFRNLAGTVASADAATGVVTLKDTASKQNVTVTVTPASDLRALPAAVAAGLAKHSAGGASASAPARTSAGAQASNESGAEGGAGRGAGGDLSQMMDRLPKAQIADLKPGAALMIVASAATDAADAPLTAIVVLSGVEPLLAQGGQAITLSPWNLGGGDAGGATP